MRDITKVIERLDKIFQEKFGNKDIEMLDWINVKYELNSLYKQVYGNKADFLWPNDNDSIEELGYEFANAKTEGYRKTVWLMLVKKIRETTHQK